jgi:hypothetical protein
MVKYKQTFREVQKENVFFSTTNDVFYFVVKIVIETNKETILIKITGNDLNKDQSPIFKKLFIVENLNIFAKS